MIFFDNSASSFYKPPAVFKAVDRALKSPFNPSRACHKGSYEAGLMVYNARRAFSSAYNCKLERVIFCGGCTEALNLAILGTARRGGHTITTIYEHNSVLRPLYELKRAGVISLSVVASPQEARAALRQSTYLLAVNHISNVTGHEADLAGYAQIARQNNLLFLLDAAQSAGYKKIDIEADGLDMVAVAPHKGLHGIQGAGVLMLSDNPALSIKPIKYGGTGTFSSSVYQPLDIPEGFEAGTVATPAICAAHAGLEWSMAHLNENAQKLKQFSGYLIEKLKSVNGITVYSKPNDCGIVAFNFDGLDSTDAGNIFDEKYDIALRCGFHCAPLLHEHYQTKSGMVRVSMGVESTAAEVDEFIKAVKEMAGLKNQNR